MKHKMGKLITFEGIEGSGKSTHAGFLAEKMRSARFKVILLREPGGTQLGEKIRTLLSAKDGDEKMCAQAELLLFMASRAQLVARVILPALRRGIYVICDRFLDSTAAYQGYARGCSLELVNKINAFAVQDILPDLTVLLDLAAKVGFRRLAGRNRRNGTCKDRIESESLAFHRRVRHGYLALARKMPRRFLVINAGQPIGKVQDNIWKAVRNVVEH